MKPLVSVLIPCYNASRWIETALQSVLKQSYPALDVIVVDDGSTDDSVALLNEFRDSRLKVIRQPNMGAAKARNRALDEAQGEFLQYLDADDILSPLKVSRHVEVLADGDPFRLLSCRWSPFRDGTTPHVNPPFNSLFQTLTPVEFLRLKYQTHHMMQPAAWFMSRALYEKAGRWDERFGCNPNDDGEYFDRVVRASSKIVHLPEDLVFYRTSVTGSLSRQLSDVAVSAVYQSYVAGVDALLKLESSEETRAASATLLQRFVFQHYPGHQHLIADAAVRVRELGGSQVDPCGGRVFHALRRLVGWKLARRLEHFVTRYKRC
jgi:GT2 family glycosyltransferase